MKHRTPWLGFFGRQIVRDVLVHVAIATCAGIALYTMIDGAEKANQALRKATAKDLLLLELAGLPVVYQLIAPFAALVGSLTAMAALARRQELVVMLAAGGSPLAFLKPALIAGLLLAGLYASITEWVVPPSRTMKTAVSRRLGLSTRSTDVLRAGRMWFKGKDRIYRVEDLEDEHGRALGGVMMLTVDRGRLIERIDAERLTHDGTSWLAFGVLTRRFDNAGIVTSSVASATMDLFERPEDFVRSVGAPDRLPLVRLYESTLARERLGQPSTEHRLELYRRFGHPLSIWLAVALGAGLALALGRRPGLALALGAGVGLGFTLWLVDEMSLALASAAALAPDVAAQLGPQLVLIGTLYVWLRALFRGVRQ